MWFRSPSPLFDFSTQDDSVLEGYAQQRKPRGFALVWDGVRYRGFQDIFVFSSVFYLDRTRFWCQIALEGLWAAQTRKDGPVIVKKIEGSQQLLIVPSSTTHLIHGRNKSEIHDLSWDPVTPIANHRCRVVSSQLGGDL